MARRVFTIMDEKKKILLGEKDIMSKDNEDLFINLNLSKTFSEIRNDKYENIFDVEAQFKKERNSSRDFRIYGIIDSTITDCDNLTLRIYKNATSGSGIVQLSGFIKNIHSSELAYGGYNPYGKKRGKYLLELSGYTNDYVYIKILSNNSTYRDQIYSQQLIFRDADGNFIDYGTQTIDINDNGDAVEINNDFYFLYNKHWIKKDLAIEEEKPAAISFSATPISNIVSETSFTSTLNPFSLFSIVLDKPSPFGLESAKLDLSTYTLNPSNEIFVADSNFNLQTLPITLNFSPGEQIKNYYFLSPLDNIQEFTENVVFELNNFNYVQTGSPLSHTFFVEDLTEKNKVILNFQNIYQNRNYFYGQIVNISSTSNYSFPMPSVLRNGLKFEGTPMEFYPIDTFNLKIKNIGSTTILPINPALGILTEQTFTSGQELQFNNINIQYTNTEYHTIELNFKTKTYSVSNGVYYNAMNNGFTINDVPIVDYWLGLNYKFDYDTIVACLKRAPLPNGQNISGWNRYSLDMPFDVIENVSTLTVTLKAKSLGVRLDIKPYGFNGNIFNPLDTVAVNTMTAHTIQSFVYSAQTPLEITLAANVNNNNEAQYEFELSKVGFDKMSFINSPLVADINPPVYYLASGYNTILRNWDDTTNTIVYNHNNVTSNLGNSPRYPGYKFGFYNYGEAYINGVVFLANLYFDNTTNTSSYLPGSGSLNVSHAVNSANNFSRDFLPSPILVIPETSSYYSTQNRQQKGVLRIEPKQLTVNPPIMDRSFDFRTGSTGPFTTYYHSIDHPINGSVVNNSINDTAYGWWNYNRTSASGTSMTTLNFLGLKQYLQTGYVSQNLQSKGLIGITPITYSTFNLLNINTSVNNLIELIAPAPGIPFEITNIKGFRNSNGTPFNNDAIIEYIPLVPNELIGVTLNQGNNHMGGYSLTRPSTPIIAPLPKVTFENSTYVNSNGITIVKIKLDSPSILGNESVKIIHMPSSAILNTHYSQAQTLPIVLSWTIGEQEKTISFTNLSFPFVGTRTIKLGMTNLLNVSLGAFTNTDIVLI